MRSKHIQKCRRHSSFHLYEMIWLVVEWYFNLGMRSMQIRKTVPFSTISYFLDKIKEEILAAKRLDAAEEKIV